LTRAVLITDGEQRSALAAVRSLGKSGYNVFVCSKSGQSIAGASRYVAAERAVPSPLSNPSGFATALRALLDGWHIDVLLPMTEEAFNALFAHPEALAGVCVPAANAAQFSAVSDKKRVLELAGQCGLNVPDQHVIAAASDVDRLLNSELHFPLVVKPVRSVSADGSRQQKRGAVHCRDAAQLRDVLATFSPSAYPLLLQQRIVGAGVGIFLLIWDGEVVASFAHRRLTEKPPAGGVSVYRESIEADATLVERSRLLLEKFGWRGVAMIEYKVEESTGRAFIMEINGRFWGSLQLAIDAGVDFPSLLLARASGLDVAGPSNYKLGIRSRWEWGSIDYLLARLRHTDRELSLPASSPGRLRSVLSALLPWRPGDRLEVLRLDDPRPFLRETREYFRRA
jgi:predicted ATP-grasp superfamily ATP-dependent carboligase